MNKKSFILCLAMMILPLLASAHDFEVDGIYYNITSEEAKQAEVTYKGDYSGEYNEYSGSITIPATVTHNGVAYSVTSIGKSAFYDCSSLTDITLPEGVTSIGERAFYDCSSLTAITIPESVTSIGDEAFFFCSSLAAIVVAKGNKVYDSRGDCNAIIETNSNTLIQGCATTIIPEGVTSIGGSAFSGCSSLTDITIPEGVTSIGIWAFRDCSSLTAITIPEGVTSIGGGAFLSCSGLTSITIPEGVTNIGESAFAGCSSLTSITIPEGVTSIRDLTFADCTSLTSITIPEGVTSIGEWTFAGCSSLTDIAIPKGVTSIGDLTFSDCTSLTSITIPEGVTSIGEWTFAGCSSLAEITCKAATPPTIGDSGTFNEVDKFIPVYVPESSVDAYKTAKYWNEFCNIVAFSSEKCATPTISYVDGKVVLTCETEEAKVITTIERGDDETREEMEFNYIPTHTFTAYATKKNYGNSDKVTLTLCWVPCTEEHESEETGILTIPSKPVLISTQGGTITLSGLAEGTEIAVYTTASTELATATATNGTATLTTGLEAGSIAIVKIGNYSIKVAIK